MFEVPIGQKMAVLVVCVFANGAQSWHEKMLAAQWLRGSWPRIHVFVFFASKHRGQIRFPARDYGTCFRMFRMLDALIASCLGFDHATTFPYHDFPKVGFKNGLFGEIDRV